MDEKNSSPNSSIRSGVCWLFFNCGGWFAGWEEGDNALEIRARINEALSQSEGGIGTDLGKGWKHLYLRRNFSRDRSGACVGRRGLRWVDSPGSRTRISLVSAQIRKTKTGERFVVRAGVANESDRRAASLDPGKHSQKAIRADA